MEKLDIVLVTQVVASLSSSVLLLLLLLREEEKEEEEDGGKCLDVGGGKISIRVDSKTCIDAIEPSIMGIPSLFSFVVCKDWDN